MMGQQRSTVGEPSQTTVHYGGRVILFQIGARVAREHACPERSFVRACMPICRNAVFRLHARDVCGGYALAFRWGRDSDWKLEGHARSRM